LFTFRISAPLAIVAATLILLPQAEAQTSGTGWFFPGQPHAAAPAHPAPRSAARPAPAPEPEMAPGPNAGQAADNSDVEQPPVQLPAPPIPALPALAKGAPPPAPLIGVLGVPEVMRASIAAQEVERVISERRQKLADDAQREQNTWRQMQQAMVDQRAKLTQDQLRARERELQDRITRAQHEFQDRNRIIQEAAQYSLNQIESTLIAVIRQVAESRNMNLVLHRSQVALNVNEFDITDAVTTELNKILPSVKVPAENVDPAVLAKAEANTPPPVLTSVGAPQAVLQNSPANGPSAMLPPSHPSAPAASAPAAPAAKP
jgi:Skp family chaperone for outer membrane proteins